MKTRFSSNFINKNLLKNLIKSIKNTLFLVGDDVTIYPGHGPLTLVKDEIEQNPFLN